MEDNEAISGVSFISGGESVQTEFGLSPALQERFELRSVQRNGLKRDTKRIGDVSEAQVIAALTKLGYHVLLPFGENHRYDVVIDDGEHLYRVQVKTGRLRDGVIKYNCSSSHAHRGGAYRPYFGQIDYLAVYCPETGKVYVLPEKELTATKAHLRVSPPSNNVKTGIRWAADFELA